MSRRIHELAKEWDLETRDLLAGLERLKISGKRAQSAVSDDEADRLARELGAGAHKGVRVGEERIRTGTAGERVVERRVGKKVIRRRATAARRLASGATASAPLQPIPVEAPPYPTPTAGLLEPTLTAFAEPVPFTESVPPPVPPLTEEVPDLPETAEVPAEPEATPAEEGAGESREAETHEAAPVGEAEPEQAEPAEPIGAEEAPAVPEGRESAEPTEAPAESGAATPAGPKILGKIDLKKQEAERAKALGRAQPGRAAPRGPAMMPEMPPTPGKPGKRKKRRVIEKPEYPEMSEREMRRGRIPRKKRAAPGKEQKKTEITTPKASKRVIKVEDAISVGDLARAMGVKASAVVKKLMESGMMATINQALDFDTASLIAGEFGYNVERTGFDVESAIEVGHEPGAEGTLESRPPVITIMGHVDHGKTSLLDAIRETDVISGEAGGITQHIGAYGVDVDGKKVTFLDTPGHEAFTSMRARGAKVTDIVVIVVAADDGVMPQTVEAINHAKAADVPIVVAINKIDRPEANLDRVRQALSDHGLLPEDWGGQTICVPVSAKTREGLPQLLEMLLLQAELMELKANPEKPARGAIVEAKLDRGRGPVATVLVQEGTLRGGDPFVCGPNHGRIRAMIDDKGRKVDEAGPSTPVEILGLSAVPEAGSAFVVVADEATARQVADHRAQKQREATLSKTSKVSLEDLYRQIQTGDAKELKVVIKADVQGSVEALGEALTRLSSDEVRLSVIHASVGGISESDVMLASASNAIVIGFNVRPEAKASEAAEREGVELRLYTVIYDALNDVRDAMEGLLEPTYREKVVGRAEVREVFNIPGVGTICGCAVTNGYIRRNASARLVRDHVVVHESKVASLKRFKEDAREVQTGYECGIGLEGFQDVKVGDVIETYELEEVARRLSAPSASRAAEERAV